MSQIPPSYFSSLYDEADELLMENSVASGDDLCPLYHALGKVGVRYRDAKVIGVGGMKEVLRVYDERTERQVALARPKEGSPVERYDAFLREAHITARLEHPNIIKLFDMGIDDERRPYFTMEFKRGRSLRKILSVLRSGQELTEFPYERRLSIFLRVCEAVAYAHSRHVLHLDLKPDNIQVGPFGEVQVCDWGMGEIERGESEEHLSEALLDPDLYGDQLEQSVKGTPGYMAPEQLEARTTKSDRTDIYALGCLLYELGSLARPPVPEDLSALPSPALVAIVNKACAVDPKARYSNAELLRKDVSRHLLGFSARAEESSLLREIRLFVGRHRVTVAISVSFLVTLAVVGAWFAVKLERSYRETRAALANAEVARDEAQHSLGRYEREKNYATALLRTKTAGVGEESDLLLNTLVMDETVTVTAIENALAVLNEALSKNLSKNNELWSHKGYALFMIQRFDEAMKHLEVRVGNHGDLRDLIPEFGPKVRPQGLLPADELIRLFQKMAVIEKGRNPMIEKMLIYDSLHRNNRQETAQIIEAVLLLSNPFWADRAFEYSEEKNSLKIVGKRMQRLVRPKVASGGDFPSYSLLRLLELESLDISGSTVTEAKQLDGLDLKELTIRRGQLKPEELKLLPQSFKIHFVAAKGN
ncbi:serine/threonine-protein kinase (plasmid) [Verrucomicrobiaceae bacterium 227]